ncbi:type II secretion system protein [Deinococcus xinjiangensis]|uniref:type II secretion system protein n=1 Tax=Deinococcus xinjiangensis TaxID=457454 RepID=UPI003365826D
MIPSLLYARRAANDADASTFLRNVVTLAEMKRVDDSRTIFTSPTSCTPTLQSLNSPSVIDCQFRQDSSATYAVVQSITGHTFHFDGQRVVGPLASPPTSW